MTGALDLEALRGAVRDVIRRHSALHVRFDEMGEYQEVVPSEELDLPLYDLTDVERPEQDEAVNQIIVDRIATAPMDLATGPLVRAMLVRLDEQRHLFILAAHHIVVDGWAAGVLREEISAAYSARVRGEMLALPAPDSFREYVRLEQEARETPDMEASLDYWRDRFASAPAPLELPLDRPRGPDRSHAGSTQQLGLKPGTYAAAQSVSAAHSSTMFVTLLAACQTLLFRLSGQDDLVIGIPSAGQAITGMYGLVGHCVNLLPVRSVLDGDMSVADHMRMVRTAVLDAHEHQGHTFGSILRNISVERDPSRLPLVEVIFNLDRDPETLDFAGLESRFHVNPKRAVNFDLFFNISEGASGLRVDLDYNSDLFDATTIERWIGHYENLVVGMAADPEATLDELPLMSPAESAAILAGGQGSQG